MTKHAWKTINSTDGSLVSLIQWTWTLGKLQGDGEWLKAWCAAVHVDYRVRHQQLISSHQQGFPRPSFAQVRDSSLRTFQVRSQMPWYHCHLPPLYPLLKSEYFLWYFSPNVFLLYNQKVNITERKANPITSFMRVSVLDNAFYIFCFKKHSCWVWHCEDLFLIPFEVKVKTAFLGYTHLLKTIIYSL